MGCGCGKHQCDSGRVSIGVETKARKRAIMTPNMWGVLGIAAAVAFVVGLAVAVTGQPATAPAPAKPETKAAQPAKVDEMGRPVGVRNWGSAEPKPLTPGCFRIATYNIENLFLAKAKDAKDDKPKDAKPAAKPEGGENAAQPVKPEDHCKAAADAIRKINADVIALQEVESLETITAFRDKYLSDMGYKYIASIDAGDPRGIECSVLSRLPLSDAKVFLHEPLTGNHPEMLGNKKNPEAGKPMVMKRSPLVVKVTVPRRMIVERAVDAGLMAPLDEPDLHFFMIAVHHKSGREYGYLRGAEAKRTAEIGNELLKADPEARVVVLGDFNAQGDELAVKSYVDAGYIDLYGDRERDDATSVTHSSGRAIDHMMFNANFAKVVAKGSRFVLGTIDRPKGVDWRTTPEPAGWASDHYPVVVDFRPVN